MPTFKDEPAMYEYSKDDVRSAIQIGDRRRMREISNYFFKVSGIYRRLILLFACMPTFDNLIIPHISSEKAPKEKLMVDFQKSLDFIDSLDIKQTFPLITLSLFKNGVYFGYLRDDRPEPVIQELPMNYCRSKFKDTNRHVVEFNLEYFDQAYRDSKERLMVLQQFPDEFMQYYNDLKTGKLQGMEANWVLLNTDKSICFKMPDEMPFFLSVIVDLIELREAKNIEMKKEQMELFQLLVQKLPINKEGDLVFDLPEAKELHKNAVAMLQNNEGIDVLTTFAEVDMQNIREAKQVVRDNLLKNERSVYNESGVSKMVMATEGNISLKYSLQKDEAIFNLLWPQFNTWLSYIVNLQGRGSPKYFFEVWIPPVTIFNQTEMEQKYTKLATYGYAKLLPGILTGMSQNSLINLMKFENDYLELNDRMEPLKSTHTMSPSKQEETKETGRESKPDEEKEDETVDNIESDNQEGGE